ILLASLAFGCRAPAHSKDLESVSVTLERTACYGTCPVYIVTIHGNGLVEYVGRLHVDIPGYQRASIQPDSFNDLVKAFETNHFTSLKESYLGRHARTFQLRSSRLTAMKEPNESLSIFVKKKSQASRRTYRN